MHPHRLSQTFIILLFSFLGVFQVLYGQTFLKKITTIFRDTIPQDTMVARPHNFDTKYLRDYSAYILPTLYLSTYTQGISVNTQEKPFSTVSYSPSQPARIGGSMFYKWLGFAFSFPLPIDPNQERKQGHTRSSDWQFNLYFRKWGMDLYYQQYRGFYINNSTGIYPGYNSDIEVQRTDLQTFNVGANAFYVFNNKRFSYQAAFNQAERQLKSAGSFITLVSLNQFQIRGDSTLVPLTNPATDNRSLLINEAKFQAAGVSIGYAHTFVVKKKAFFSLTLLPGIAIGSTDFLNTFGEHQKNLRAHYKLNIRSALGFNGDRYYYGISLFADINNIYFNEKTNLSFTTANAFVFFGRRFSAEWILLKRATKGERARTLKGHMNDGGLQ